MSASTQAPEAPARHPVRPFYWSVRRELWENRAIYLAPLAVAGVIVLAFLYASHGLAREVRIASGLLVAPPTPLAAGKAAAAAAKMTPAARAGFALVVPYLASGFAMMATAAAVGVFYALGSLYGERRDRTVLFWKSLPVSDLTTVLSKAVVPLAILPAVAIVSAGALHLILLAWSALVLTASGLSPGLLLDHAPVGTIWVMFAYAVASLALWWAPITGWLMLVSAWAKRMTFLWAVTPPLAICLFERLAFGTDYAWRFLHQRLAGGLQDAFAPTPHGRGGELSLSLIRPLQFLADPALWGGLAFAAACLAACAWLRRRRDPI